MDWSEDRFIAQTPEHGYFIRKRKNGCYTIIKRDRTTGKATRLNVEYNNNLGGLCSAKRAIYALVHFNNFQLSKEQALRIIRKGA